MPALVHVAPIPGIAKRRMISLVLIATVLSSGCLGAADEVDVFYGEDINPPRPTADFVLFDQNGDPVAFNDYLGDVVVVAFLFTRCLLYTSDAADE